MSYSARKAYGPGITHGPGMGITHGPGMGTAPATVPVSPAARLRVQEAFFPPECKLLPVYKMPPETIPAGVPVVMTWTVVKATNPQVLALRSQIVGGVSAKPWPSGAAPVWFKGENSTPLGPALVELARAAPSNFADVTDIAFGIIEERENPSFTKGAVWLSVTFSKPKSKTAAHRLLESILKTAAKRLNLTTTGTGADLPMTATATIALAPDNTDDGLRRGAYMSAAAAGQWLGGLAMVFSMAGILRPSAEIASPIQNRAVSVAEANSAVSQVAELPAAIGTAIGMARKDENIEAARAGLDRLIATLQAIKLVIERGLSAIPSVLHDATTIRSGVLRTMRESIMAQAQAALVNAIPFGIAREYQRCMTLRSAWNSYEQQVDTMLSLLERGVDSAIALDKRRPEASKAMAAIDKMITKIEHEKTQLGKDWWERSAGGLPTWGWGVIGGGVVIGGAVFFRVRKKRRAS